MTKQNTSASAPEAGHFITLEGGEGAGKSTLAKALAARLGALGLTVELTREPGGSPKAERIRNALLAGQIKPYGAFAEALMFSAARIDHVDRRIKPALARGAWVICDRFIDSTRVYQGALGAIGPEKLAALETVAIAGLKPELTLILDLAPEIGLARAASRRLPGEAVDRFEGETLDFHRRLRQAFLDIAAAEPGRCVVLDASRSPEQLAEQAWQALASRLRLPQIAPA
ncbi:MAG: dTMP kinase [Bosea sp.]|uniref:dTMP kinase n=1 Tax=Bosea sp. (in: a-proteobacteria) TaxID=1871050 RepID=UPI001AC506F6|nr:dTMP kinase [Bosea sp. (in: a-proteobacteria)]MBN9467951.1 dTMP kinase [Bosea sp. (in: a-proteobacteria)]